MKGYRRVAKEEFHHILKQIHDKDCLHAGSRKTYARVSSIFVQLKYHICVTKLNKVQGYVESCVSHTLYTV